MALYSQITTEYKPDVPRELSASYRMGQADRTFLDAQMLGVQQHLADSLIRGQIGSNFQVSSASAALQPGDVFCGAPETAIDTPSSLSVRRVTKATSVALAAAGIALGIAVGIGSPGTWVRGAMEGIVGPAITGLAPGSAGFVRVSAAGRAERVGALSTGDVPLGYVDGYGNLSLMRERAVSAGGGGGGYGTVQDEGTPLTARAVMNFVGAGVTAVDSGGVTTITIPGGSGPSGSAVGQTQVWNGSAWAAGALDLADADARTGTLPAGNGGTGIAGAGGTANRVLVTTNGTSWAAGLVALATMVSGTLPFANLADGSATSVLGRSLGTSGVQASIAAASDGQTLRRAAGVLGFGQLDLASANAITGLLPLANLTGGSAVGQVLRNTAGNVPAWGALDLADSDAVTGLLPFGNFANGSATSVFARASGTTGVMASLAATADGQFLQRVGGALVWATVSPGGLGGGTAVGQVLTNATGNVPTWGALDLADSDAVTGLLPFANVASLAGLSVLGRSANTSGVMAAITGTDGLVLRVAGTTLAFGTVVTAGLADSNVTLAKLANGTASSVLGRSAATGGVYADIVSSADGQVLRRGASGVIGFGAVDLADTDAVTGLLPHANVANLAALSVFGRSANTAGVMAAITGTDGLVLRVAGTALGFGQIVGAGVTDGTLTLAKLANGTAASVLGRGPATSGAYADIAATADGQVLRRAAGVVGFGAVDLADADAITGLLPFANLTSGAATSVLGRSLGSAGAVASIAASADGQVLTRVGGALAFATIGVSSMGGGTAVGQVLTNAVGNVPTWGALDLADSDAVTGLLPFANVASLAGLSVFGRSANTSGVMAAITGVDGQVLRVSGTTLGFGTIAGAGLTDNTVTMAKLADLAGLSVIGRGANTLGVPAAITATATGQVLRYSGTTIAFGALDLADADAITGTLPFANLATGSAASVLARSAGTAGVMASLAATADGQFLQRISGSLAWASLAVGSIGGGTAVGQVLRNTAGNIPAWGAVDLADSDAVTGVLAFARLPSVNGLSVLGRSASSSGVLDQIPGAAGQILRVDATGTALNFGTISGASIDANTIALSKLSVSVGAPSLVGRAGATNGSFGEISATTDGHILRRSGGTLSFGALDLADADAITGALPLASLTPSGTNGRVLITTAGVAAWGFALGNNSDGFTYNGGAHNWYVAGTRKMEIDAGAITLHQSAIRWDTAFTPTLGQNSDPTNGVTAKPLAIFAQGAEGTGATVGGRLELYGGASLTGTGGEILLSTGNGATQHGSFTVKVGASNTMFQIAQLAGVREVISLFDAVTTTVMPSDTGDKVVHWASATTVPSVRPVGTGATLYVSAAGELGMWSSTDGGGGQGDVRIGDGTNAVYIKAGGSTNYDIYLTVNSTSAPATTRLAAGYIDFESGGSTAGFSSHHLRFKGQTCVSMSVNAGVPQVGFYGSTGAPKAADPVALTAAFGTADNTIADVGGAFNQTTLNNNFKDLATKYNALRDILRGVGLSA